MLPPLQLDLAITGQGFFQLQDEKDGSFYYTRLGRFELDRNGFITLIGHPNLRLTTKAGDKISAIQLLGVAKYKGAELAGMTFTEKEHFTILEGIYTNGEVRDLSRLFLASFFDNSKLQPSDDHIYRAPKSAMPMILSNPTDHGAGRIVSKAFEDLDQK